MPKALTHVVVLTDDYDATMRFLTDVCRLGPVNEYSPAPADLAASLGWPADAEPTRAAIVGEGPGSIDLVAIPPALRATVTPGAALLAVPTADVDDRVSAARTAGFDAAGARSVSGAGGMAVTMAPVTVGGVGYEFIRFG